MLEITSIAKSWNLNTEMATNFTVSAELEALVKFIFSSGPLISAYEAEDLKTVWILASIANRLFGYLLVMQCQLGWFEALDDNQELHRKMHQLQAWASGMQM